MTRFCQEPDEGSQFYFAQMQLSEVVQTKEDFCLMRVVGKYLDSASVLPVDLSGAFLCLLCTPDGTTNLEEYVPEEIIMAAESVLGHVHAEVLGRLITKKLHKVWIRISFSQVGMLVLLLGTCRRSEVSLKMGAPKEVQTPGEFRCELCELSAPYTYYGQMPPNSTLSCLDGGHHGQQIHQADIVRNSLELEVRLLEKAYVMKDPITPDKDKFFIVGSHCSLCTRADCSLFYSKSFCLPCVKENLNAFPLEIKEDMDKRKPQQKSCRKNGYKA